ncbi:acyltransferase family protein [Providencia rettgeri]
MSFRYDINFLRAIAVMAVVIFHFKPTFLPGGFSGVDIFFVISGYLMTGIIFKGFDKNNFSLVKFYIARANRIIPPLAFLCLILLVFGWFYLSTIDYKNLTKHIASSISFISNIIYSRESDYFDSDANYKWLLHTWSLSVEWQFYIIYPVLLLGIKKFFSIKTLKKAILIITILSLISGVILSINWPLSSYFLLQSRAWELLFGAVAYLYPIKKIIPYKNFIFYISLTSIILCFFFLSNEVLWPGYLAIIPVVSTYLIIITNQKENLLFKNSVFQSLGKWSYSIYLWHWPIVVFGHYNEIGSVWIYIGITLSIILGFLSYRFIERIKFTSYSTWNKLPLVKPIWFIFIIFSTSSIAYYENGTNYNNSSNPQHVSAQKSINDWDYPSPNLFIDGLSVRYIEGNSKKNILFIGASHIEQLYPYVKENHADYNVYFLTQGGCFMTPSMKHPKWSCNNIQNYEKLFNKVHFDKVVTSLYCLTCKLPRGEKQQQNELNTRISEFNNFLSYIKHNANSVYLILGEPQGREFDPTMSIRFNLPNRIKTEDIVKQYEIQNKSLKELTQLVNVRGIDPIQYLCNDYCNVMDKNNNYFYKDDNHMRPWYAKKYLTYLSLVFANTN